MSADLVARMSARLDASARAIEALVGGVEPALARFQPAPGKWSILEILAHLGDEERNDFRPRIESTLQDPGRAWAPIHPERWVREGDFNSRPLRPLLDEFLAERRRSLAWLATLGDAGWDRSHTHIDMGDFTAASMLAAWAAHDVLHIRQISGVIYAHLARETTPSRVDYSGTW